jgi:hypothetical protein
MSELVNMGLTHGGRFDSAGTLASGFCWVIAKIQLTQSQTENLPPGSSTIGSAAVYERTRSAQAFESCAIGGQVL